MSEAFNKLYQFNAALRAKKRTAPTRSVVFHYTTVDGLQGIIERNYLQASSAYFLNDSSEITHGSGIVCDALKKWQSENRSRQASVPMRLAGELQELFTRDIPGDPRTRPVYVACFCEDDNLLSQWRAYGQAGGYSLGFRMASGRDGMQPEPNIYTAEWVKVEYGEKEQLASCNAILDGCLPILSDPVAAEALRGAESDSIFGYSQFRQDVEDLLVDEIVSFKDKAFEVEKEWRIVVRPRRLLKQAKDDGGNTPARVYFRPSKGILVPYVKLLPTTDNGRLPIDRVWCSPTLDKARTEAAVSMLLRANSFTDVTIRGSDIPVRM